jgi:hypothetical protein
MKPTVLFLFLIFTLNSPTMAQENTDSILSLGVAKLLEYFMNNEEIKNINYLEIRQRDGDMMRKSFIYRQRYGFVEMRNCKKGT